MIFRSLCSGIEAASVAWHPLGWRADAVAEVEPFPCFALAHHYGASRPWRMPDPDQAASLKERRHRAAAIKAVSRLPEHGRIPNLGDITQYRDWPDATFDLLVGGTPCQSFSVAGLRKGLADPRGNLMLTYLAIAQRYRPKWLVWENVPGVLSDDGNAFGTLLRGLAELGYGFAYRVLDAQYVRVDGFGRAVPQRRRRVFVVGHLGDWRRAAAVLFDRESLSGNPAPRRQAGQGFACDVVSSLVSSGRGVERPGETRGQDPVVAERVVSGTLQTTTHDWTRNEPGDGIVAHALRADGFDASEDGTGRGTPIVPVCFSAKDYGADAMDDCSPTLRSGGFKDSHANAGVMPAIAYEDGILHAHAAEADASAILRRVRQEIGEEAFAEWGLGILASLQPEEILRSALHGSELRPASFSRRWVVYCTLSREKDRADGAMQSMREAAGPRRASQGWQPPKQLSRELGAYLSELSQPGPQAERFLRDLRKASEGIGVLLKALTAAQAARRPASCEGQSTSRSWRVRRLMVEECEFLQGFPRGYTDVPYRGRNSTPDGPRYKALGNSKAVNVMRWIGTRIEAVDQINAEAV